MSYSKTNWQDLPNQTTPITVSRLNNMENGIANSDGAIGVNEYSTSTTYSVGDYCLYNNKLYRCKTAISTAEAWNSAHWTEIKIVTEIDNTNNNIKTSLQTAEAKSLTITNCAPVNGKLNIKSGETEQAEYEGYNEFQTNFTTKTSNGVTITKNPDGSLIFNGTATGAIWEALNNVFTQQSGDYTLKLNEQATSNTWNTSLSLRKTGASGNIAVLGLNLKSLTYSLAEETELTVYFYAAQGTVFNNFKIYPMIYSGTTDKTYEPYTGEISSPNPDYPQDVISVGSNVNLLNNTATTQTINGLTVTVNPDKSILINGTASATTLITIGSFKFLANQPYYVSGCPNGGTASTYRIDYRTSNESVDFTEYGQGGVATKTQDITLTAKIRIENGYTCNNLLFKPQIKKEVSGYIKYGCGSVDFLVRNKNLINTEFEQGARNNSDGKTLLNMNTYVRTKNPIYVLPNTQYIATINKQLTNGDIHFYDKNDNFLGSRGIGSSFTTPTDCKKINIQFYNPNGITVDVVAKAQLERRTTATEYVEGKSETITVPLPEGMKLCKIGTAKDYIYKSGNKWYKHKEIDRITVNGTEDWSLNRSVGSYYQYRYPVNLDIPNNIWGNVNLQKCSHFIVGDINNLEGYCFTIGGTGYIGINSNISSRDDFKTWLATQFSNRIPVEIYYVLATPVEEEITDTDTLEGLYQIEHLLMYEGYTTIECINEMKPDIQAEYLYNNEINTTIGGRFDEVENNIRELDNRNNYSTEEQVIGKWINGKPLYRKVIKLEDTNKIYNGANINTNISNIEEICDIRANCTSANRTGLLTIPRYADANNFISLTVETLSNGTLTVNAGSNYTSSTTRNVIIIIEYTKTTD